MEIGNLHVNILKGEMSEEDWNNKLTFGIREVFEFFKNLGEQCGEHGDLVWSKKVYVDIVFINIRASEVLKDFSILIIY